MLVSKCNNGLFSSIRMNSPTSAPFIDFVDIYTSGKKSYTFKEKFFVFKIDVTGSSSFQEYITNSDQMKHTCRSKRCQNSHMSTQCTPSGGNAGVYFRMQTIIKVPNVIMR